MRNIFRACALFLVVGLLTLPQGGCSQAQQTWDKFQNAVSVATSAKVPVREIVLARNAFNAVEIAATAVLRTRTCDGTNGPICRPPQYTQPIIDAIRKGISAREDLKAFMRDHPGELGPAGLLDAFKAATATLNDLIAKSKP
jgi:hypothetical protein